MKYSDALNRIHHNLMNGEQYGYLFPLRDDYPDERLAGKDWFWKVLEKHDRKNLICWTHYGSSANKATKADLHWIITVIFDMTPEQFEQKYTTRTAFRETHNYSF